MRFPPFLLTAFLTFATPWIPTSDAAFIVVPLAPGDEWKFIEVGLPAGGNVREISHGGAYDNQARSIKWGPLSPQLKAVMFEIVDVPAGGSLNVVSSPSGAATDTIEIAEDADGDGIPAPTESQLGLSDTDPDDAGDDLDRDGVDNLTEHLAGTAVNDPASRPSIGSVRYEDETGTLVIALVEGRTDTVRVESAIRLDSTEWLAFSQWFVDATKPSELRLAVSRGELSRRLFRLRWGDARVFPAAVE